MYYTKNQKNDTSLKSLENLTPVELQNHFHGLIWGLMNKGRIFEKLLLHPLIQNIRCGPPIMSQQEAPKAPIIFYIVTEVLGCPQYSIQKLRADLTGILNFQANFLGSPHLSLQ